MKLSNWHQKFYQVFRRKVARFTVAASHRHRLLKFHNATFKIVQNAIIRIFSSYLSTHSISTWPNLIQPKLNAEPHLFTTIFLTILHPFVFLPASEVLIVSFHRSIATQTRTVSIGHSVRSISLDYCNRYQ